MSAVSSAAHAALTPLLVEQSLPPDSADPVAMSQRAIAGDADAIEELIAWIRPKIVRYCRAKFGRDTGSYHLADDVAQDVCVAVVSALPNYREMGRPFMAFVYGITAHKVADARRRESRTPSLTLAELPDAADDNPGPEDSVLRISEAQRARALLDRLPPQQRDLLLLRVVAGLSSEETGKALGMTPGAVRVQQHRSLVRLRELAADTGFE